MPDTDLDTAITPDTPDPLPATGNPPGHRRLSRELDDLVTSLEGRDTTLGAIVDGIGERGFGLLLAILALPAALPLPAPGYATPFGILMIGLGTQMILGRHRPTLPRRARERTIRYKTLAKTIKGARLPLGVAERLVRPRLPGIARNRTVHSLLGLVIVLMSCFMALPIPLTNTAPSFVIFLLACGMIEEDGLLMTAGLLLAPAAGTIAAAAVYYGYKYGWSALEGGLHNLLQMVTG